MTTSRTCSNCPNIFRATGPTPAAASRSLCQECRAAGVRYPNLKREANYAEGHRRYLLWAEAELVADPKALTRPRHLHKAYLGYVIDEGIDVDHLLAITSFKRSLRRQGFDEVKIRGKRFIRGARVRYFDEPRSATVEAPGAPGGAL